MIFNHEAKTVTLSQSWIDTASRCAERGRLDVVAPVREEGDAAFAGTSMHKAIELYLSGQLDLADMEAYAARYAEDGARNGVLQDARGYSVRPAEEGEGDTANLTLVHVSYKSFDGPEELVYHAGNCTKGWIADVLPMLVENDWLQGQSEVKFEFEAFIYRGYTVILKGTCDWVPDVGNTVIDWKSSGSDYKQKQKQQHAVQPTVYCAAAVAGCFGREFALPVEFKYGVAIRLKTKARGQIVTVQRTQAHVDWLYHRIRTFIDLGLDIGMDRPWPTTSEDNFLCSKKWCPWYSDCRGKFVSQSEDLFGYSP